MEAITHATRAIITFIRAPTWEEGRQVVERRRDDLLTDNADMVFAMLHQTARDHAAASQVFEAHHEVLRRCRTEGLADAFDEATLMQPKPTLPDDFDLSAQLDAQLAQIQLLLGPLSEMLLPTMERFFTQNSDSIAPMLPGLQSMIEQIFAQPDEALSTSRKFAQQPGMDSLLEALYEQFRDDDSDLDKNIEATWETLLDHVQEFVEAESWEACRVYLEQHADVLLTIDAENEIGRFIERARDRGDVASAVLLVRHRDLLRRCRAVGVDQAYAEFIGSSAAIPGTVGTEIRRARDAERHYLTAPTPDALADALVAWNRVLQHPDFSRTLVYAQIAALASTAKLTELHHYRGDRDPETLDQLIELFRRLVAHMAPNSSDLPETLENLVGALHDRYTRANDPADLDEIVDCYRRLLASLPARDSGRVAYLYHLGTALRDRAVRNQQLAGLDEAITCYRQAIELLPPGVPHPSTLFNELGASLSERYSMTGDEKDLTEATEWFQRAMEYE